MGGESESPVKLESEEYHHHSVAADVLAGLPIDAAFFNPFPEGFDGQDLLLHPR